SVLLDSFDNAASWSAEDGGGAPSAELAITSATDHVAPIGSTASLRLDATSGAGGHRIERSFGPVDLVRFTELRWWNRVDHAAGPDTAATTRLRIELGSAAMPIGSPGTWHRLVPVARPRTWELVRASLDDVDPLVATAAD